MVRHAADLEHPQEVAEPDFLVTGCEFLAYRIGAAGDDDVSLDQRFDGDSPLADRLRVFETLCDAVAFAHAQGAIHRDLKPQNIMLGAFGEVLVLDWGVAKLLGDSADDDLPTLAQASPLQETATTRALPDTARGTILGTPAYMAPEQAEGEVSALDQRTDVWSMTVLLYEMLAGRRPFTGEDVASVGDAILNAEPPPFSEIDVEVPAGLEPVVAKGLEKSPRRRYRTVRKLLDSVLAATK